MKLYLNNTRHLFSYGLKFVLVMVLVVPFTLPAYGQKKLLQELSNKVALLYQQGQYSEATDVAKEALKVAEETFNSDHPAIATSLSNLATLYFYQGRYLEAELLYKRSLAINEKVLGRFHPDVAAVLENMARFYTEIGKEDEAKRLEERVKIIRTMYQ
jgi:tetratricopeptide (TPR) repeat protein